MSVAFRSVLSGKKRLFEEHVAEEVVATLGGCGFKRARHLPPFDNTHYQPQVHRQELLLKLTQMFPEVDEKIINDVLENYGENLDAAIESLTQLRLATARTDTEGPEQTLREDTSEGQKYLDKLSPAWLDQFLGEFYTLRQPQEARTRLSQILQEFEAAAIDHYKNSSEEMVAVKNEFERMRKANLLLSRAVAVQHGKLQEASQKEEELAQKDQEMQRMKEVLMNYQERLRILELNNYSLAMHLQRATGSSTGHGDGGPPDVY